MVIGYLVTWEAEAKKCEAFKVVIQERQSSPLTFGLVPVGVASSPRQDREIGQSPIMYYIFRSLLERSTAFITLSIFAISYRSNII